MNTSPALTGRLEWIGIRPARREALVVVPQVMLEAGRGLAGDHYRPLRGGDREVTLIRQEDIVSMARALGRDALDPGLLRRNLVVAGVDLKQLVGRTFRVGEAVLRGTGPCTPCQRMDEALGPQGRRAMRGRGGLTAQVVASGTIRVGDRVEPLAPGDETTSQPAGGRA